MPAIGPTLESVTITQNPTTPEVSEAAQANDATQITPKAQRTKRGEDFGDQLFVGMTAFLQLARKTKQPARLLQLVAHVCGSKPPQALILEAQNAKAALTPKLRTQLYTWLLEQSMQHLADLEKCSARVNALTDSVGHQAVMKVLDLQDSGDALALKDPTDKWTRALYLYIEQFVQKTTPQAATQPSTRFEQAERHQSMNQHWNSKEYASHYLGPINAEPMPLLQFTPSLRQQVAALYPGINPELIVIDYCRSDDISHNCRHGDDDQTAPHIQHQHTIAATFNATRAQYRTVVGHSLEDAQVVEVDQPAAIEVVFSWESATGMLGVFCPDSQLRPALASSFQKIVLGMDGIPCEVPMCSFDLQAFASEAVLRQIAGTLVEGIQDITIQKIRLTNPIATPGLPDTQQSRHRMASSSMQISHHSRDRHHIYQVIRDVYHVAAIEGKDISHVTLSLMLKDQTDYKAHRVAVHVARPNILTHGCKSAQERQLMHRQLIAIGIMNLASH